MAERRKGKKKKDIEHIIDKPLSKEEYAIARYLKSKLPEKKTTLVGHKVEYFIASKAVDCLLESKWAKNDKKCEIHFHNRDSVVQFMERLLVHKLFHRAKKIIVQKELKKKKDDGIESSKEKEKGKGKEKEVDDSKKIEKSSEPGEKKEKKKGKKASNQPEKKTEKKKIKLDMHMDQVFVDKNEPYVWIYDPIPLKTWITGAVMVLAAVLISLFPLWPQIIRHYIYYLSVALAFFLVFIIGLVVVRLVIFVLIWLVTLGKHHLWILPNLTEDCGFFESFWPLYHYEYKGRGKVKDTEETSEEKKPKEKESGEKSEESSSEQEKKKVDANNSETEDSADDKEKGENGFEMINADDVSSSEDEDPKTK